MSVITPRLFGVEQTETTSDDYYTPRWVFERMGLTFDLDVCAPPGGIEWIPAARYYTMADDGLTSPWEGRVWMNPPFSAAGPWVDRFILHRHGVCLLPFVKSVWLDAIWDAADGVTKSQEAKDGMWFVRPDDGVYRPGRKRAVRLWFPIMFAAFGDECVEAIGRLGRVR